MASSSFPIHSTSVSGEFFPASQEELSTEVRTLLFDAKEERREKGSKKVVSRKGPKTPVPQRKITIEDMIDSLKEKFKISDDEAIIIREVMEEKTKDEDIRETVLTNQLDRYFLEHEYPKQVNHSIQDAYETRGRYEELGDPKYTDLGAIFDTMALSVIYHDLEMVV